MPRESGASSNPRQCCFTYGRLGLLDFPLSRRMAANAHFDRTGFFEEKIMTEIRVPTLGESVTEATIGRWFKKAGDPVAVDEPLVELETDKVTIEVPAPSAGTLGEIIAKDGETVAVGALLGQIAEGAAVGVGRPARPVARGPPGRKPPPRPGCCPCRCQAGRSAPAACRPCTKGAA